MKVQQTYQEFFCTQTDPLLLDTVWRLRLGRCLGLRESSYAESFVGPGEGFGQEPEVAVHRPKGPCTQIVYALALRQSIYYLGTWTLRVGLEIYVGV